MKFLNNFMEQHHQFLTRRITPGLGLGSFNTARRTLRGYEVMHMIREGQINNANKENLVGRLSFVNEIIGISA